MQSSVLVCLPQMLSPWLSDLQFTVCWDRCLFALERLGIFLWQRVAEIIQEDTHLLATHGVQCSDANRMESRKTYHEINKACVRNIQTQPKWEHAMIICSASQFNMPSAYWFPFTLKSLVTDSCSMILDFAVLCSPIWLGLGAKHSAWL